MDYFIVFSTIFIGCAILLTVIYFNYRRGLAIQITMLTSIVAIILGTAGYYVGKQGLTLERLIIAFFTILPLISGLIFWVSKSLIAPVRQILRSAQKMLAGDLDQEIQVHSHNEMEDIGAVFEQINAYFRELSETTSALSQGDLTRRLQIRGEQDILGRSFSSMIERLRITIKEIAEKASVLDMASNQLADTANQARGAVNQITITIQQVAQGTKQQSESVSRTVASFEQVSQAADSIARGAQEQSAAVSAAAVVTAQISTAIQEISADAEAQGRNANEAVEIGRASVGVVENTVKGMESIKTRVDLSTQKVQEMGQRSSQIGKIVETIDDIASQTNLLALNAAIEAARAGEHGKGFSVVADEVRKLAEKSAGATKEIADLVRDIQQIVQEAVQAMHESDREVNQGVQLADQSRQALDRLLASAENSQKSGEKIASVASRMNTMADELVNTMDILTATVEENTAAVEEMAAGSSDVTRSVENIAGVSEENSAAIEEVSASAEEINAQVEEVTASVYYLAEMAQRFKQLVSDFKLSEEASSDPHLDGHAGS
jgi:methyl-accepting chemotaxis protein